MRMEVGLSLDHLEEGVVGEEETLVDLLLAVCPPSSSVNAADGRMLQVWEERSLVKRMS